MTTPSGTQAIDRAALLLTQVVDNSEPVSFTELAAASGLAKSTTSRLLLALERNRLVRRAADGRYLPGELFIRYAWRGDTRTDLISVAQPYLDRLGEQTGETINLGVAAGAAVEQIAQVDSRFLIGGTNWVGLAVPLHCSALGKVLLAYGAAELPPGRLAQRTERTITSRAALVAELAAVRERGYAVTDEELEPGLVAVAAPVFGTGRVSGTGRIAGPGRVAQSRAAQPRIAQPRIAQPRIAQPRAAQSRAAQSGWTAQAGRIPGGAPVPVAAISVSAPASRLSGTAIRVAAARCASAAADLSVALGAGQPGNEPPGGPSGSGRRGNEIHQQEEGAA